MRWVVGLDLGPLSSGALRFAAWLSSSSTGPGGEALRGVHVLEEDHLLAALRLHHLDEVLAAAKGAATAAVARAGLAGPLGEPVVVRAATADEGLAAACRDLDGDALVVGRRAPVAGASLVRLGRVARQLARSPSCPVVVVPPDLDPADLPAGPVAAVTSLADDSIETCRFAARVAERLGRRWILVHVVPTATDYGAHYLPAASVEAMRVERCGAAARAAAAWIDRHGLRPERTTILDGQPTEAVIAHAVAGGVPLLVVGATRRTGLEQVFFHSMVVELAAGAPVPVAIVPVARGAGPEDAPKE